MTCSKTSERSLNRTHPTTHQLRALFLFLLINQTWSMQVKLIHFVTFNTFESECVPFLVYLNVNFQLFKVYKNEKKDTCTACATLDSIYSLCNRPKSYLQCASVNVVCCLSRWRCCTSSVSVLQLFLWFIEDTVWRVHVIDCGKIRTIENVPQQERTN